MFYNPKKIPVKWQKITMKSIVFSLFMLIFGACKIFAQKNDLHEMELKGKVKSFEIFTFNEKQKIIFIKECFFNKEGNFTQYQIFNIFNGKKMIFSTSDYEYNEKKQRTKAIYYDNEGKEIYKVVYQYKENEIEQIWYENNEFYAKHIKKYDEKGNVIAVFSYKKDKQLQTRGDCKYNENNIPINEIWYDENDKIVRKVSFKHDEKGKITESYESQSDTLIIKTIFTQHDKKGNWTQNKVYKNNKLTEIQERKIEYYN